MLKRINKKGVSEMVGYVLAIVLAVGLSVGVYSYLKLYIPKEKPQCKEDISLIVKSAVCTISGNALTLDITLQNKGLFSISAAYIRMAPSGRTVRDWINPDSENGGRDEEFYYNPLEKKSGLEPGDTWHPGTAAGLVIEKTTAPETGAYTIEIQPAEFSDEFGPVACEKAVITQPVICNLAS